MSDNVAGRRPNVLYVNCPACGKQVLWQGNSYRPFCSERCKTEDIANWATERYRVPDRSPLAPEADEPSDTG